jgi:predicted Zn-dependent peptidase
VQDRSPSDGTVLQSTLLPGGLRVVTEAVPGARSAALGIWVGVGSRDESEELAGTSHYLEHLLFKGTARRDAMAIASALDEVGGESNAFTDKEYTCYYARVLASDLPLAVDVISDMVTSSLLRPADVEAERSVVLEEIAMHDDDPGDAVHDLFAEALYGDTPLGRPVIGTIESIETLSRDAIDGFYRRRYVPGRMVVAAAGGVDHDETVRLVERAFGARLAGEDGAAPLRPRTGGPVPLGDVLVEDRPGEQANLLLGTSGLTRDDPRRPALAVLSAALGGGMSSRLFQSIREQRGLAYSVYSYAASASDSGTFGVYAGCAPGKVDEVVGLVLAELAAVAERGLTDAEVARAKGSLRGSTVLGLEDTGSRMSRIGKSQLVDGELPTVGQVLARTAAVTPDDVREVAADVLRRPLAMAAVGPFGDRDLAGLLR